MAKSEPPVLLVTGSKDSGKTTLVVELIRRLGRPGRPVVALKRASRVDEPSAPGTDTCRMGEAGAAAVGLTWPSGSYVYRRTAVDPGRESGAAVRLDRPASLEELVSLALAGGPPAGEPLVLAEGFSDTSYPRVHVLARPGRPERSPGGPVLDTWRLERGGAGADRLAEEVDVTLPLLRRWTDEVVAGLAGPDGVARPGGAEVTAAVLAGGRGRRLGGVDKWRVLVGGRPVGQRCLDTLTRLFDRVLVVGRGHPWGDGGQAQRVEGEGPAPAVQAGVIPVADLVSGAGPLGGLLTALSASRGRPVFVAAQDMPFLDEGLIRHMLFVAARAEGSFDALLPAWGGFIEPLHAIYGQEVLERLRRLLSSSGTLAGRRVTDAFAGLRVLEISEAVVRLFGDPTVTFLNVNTPEDLALAEAIALRPQR